MKNKIPLMEAVRLRRKAIASGADHRIIAQVQKVVERRLEALFAEGREKRKAKESSGEQKPSKKLTLIG